MDDSRKRKRVTLADVAEKAGVSVQTASHVMSGNMKVRLPQVTRDRVSAAAQALGYVANSLARAMKTGKTNVVSLWMPVDRANINYLRLLRLVSAAARRDGFDLMIVGLDSTTAYNPLGRLPMQWPSDGVLAFDAGRAIRVLKQKPENAHLPLVVLGTEDFEFADTVSWNVASGMANAVERLIATGARKIVHLTVDWVLQDFPKEQRRTGYSQTMEAHGLEPILIGSAHETSRAGETALEDYIARCGVPDAVCCFTDTLAIGAARCILLRGLRMPADCQILGYGDFPEAEDYKVAISTLAVPLEEMVGKAWDMLLQRIHHPMTPSRIAEYDMKLIGRESTLPL